MSRFHKLPLAILAGLFVFTLNHAAVVSGAVAPPEGFEPAWVLRNSDTPQYLTWVNAAQEDVLLRNYHAPWQTEPALWQPLLTGAGRLGLPPITAYYAVLVPLYIFAAWALLYAAMVFCPGSQAWYALLVAACALPLRQILWGLTAGWMPLAYRAFFLPGLLDYGYETADGFLRGGLSTSPTLTLGTGSLLLAMALLTRYLESNSPRSFALLCGTAFLSAVLHPFEIFVLIASAMIPLLRRKQIVPFLLLGISGALGVLPYVVTAARSQWLRDAGEFAHVPYHPFWILLNFGLPCFFLVQLLLMRFRMPAVGDEVLRNWFLAVPILVIIPGAPIPLHLLDGFAYCIGFLLVRRIATDAKLMQAFHTHARRTQVAFGTLLAVSLVALGVHYTQVWQDGKRPSEQALLVSTVKRKDEKTLLNWIARNTTKDTLVLSPIDVSPWVASIPRPSFASHDSFSLTFNQQSEELTRFLAAEKSSEEILDRYGVGVAVVPKESPAAALLPPDSWRTDIGPWRVYQFPQARMKPYPGLANSHTTPSMSHQALAWIGSLWAPPTSR